MATVRYLVSDVERSTAFYTKNLGFQLDQSMGPAFALVSRGDLTLWLAGPQSSAARPMPDGRRPEPGGWNRFVIEVDNLEARVEEMKRTGARFRNEIVQRARRKADLARRSGWQCRGALRGGAAAEPVSTPRSTQVHCKFMPLKQQIRHRYLIFLKNWFNPLTRKLIARSSRGPFAIVRHIGRRSGKIYETPILVETYADGFVFELTYGPDVDWFKNVQAAGGCTLHWHGKDFTIIKIEPLDVNIGLAAFPLPARLLLRALGRKHFFKMVAQH